MSHQIQAVVLLGNNDLCGRRNADRVHACAVLPLADRVAYTGSDQRCRRPVAVPVAGDAHVASRERPCPRSRGRGKVAWHGLAGRGHNLFGGRLRRGFLHRRPVRVVLDAVCAGLRVEAHADHDRVLRVPAGQRFLRAVVLLGGCVARHQGAVGRRYRHRIPVRGARAGQLSVLLAALRWPKDACGNFQHRHGRVPDCHHRVYALV